MSGVYNDRPKSSQLIDLAVYIVPPELWRDQLHSAQSQSIPETISAGFIRVMPDLLVCNLRQELENQLGEEQILPQDYVFLKNVGRCLTKVRAKQEAQLKIKSFVPPQSFVPEIFVLEGARDSQSSVHSSQASYRSDSRQQQDPYQLGSYRGSRGTFNNHKPVPPIQSGRDEIRLPLSATPPQSPAPNQHAGELHDPARRTPLSATPPASPGYQQRGAKYSNNSNEDSGIGSEDAERRRLDELQRKQLEDEERRRRQMRELERRQKEIQEQEERWRKQREIEQQRLKDQEEETRRREEAQRQDDLRRQDELRRQEDLRRQQEDDLRRQEEDRRKANALADAARQEPAYETRTARDVDSYDDRRERETPSPQNDVEQRPELTEQEKQQLIAELETLRQERFEAERRREGLVKRAKKLQGTSQNKRNQARDIWKKKYFEEKKKTPPIEEQCTKLRQELDQLHRKIMSTLEGSKERDGRRHPPDKPSMQSNLKIQATRLQHDLEDFQRRVDNIKMKLTAEMKLRNQAESELRALRAELTQKKINVTLARTGQRDGVQESHAYGAPPISTRT